MLLLRILYQVAETFSVRLVPLEYVEPLNRQKPGKFYKLKEIRPDPDGNFRVEKGHRRGKLDVW
jgi:hypothetical protein